MIAIKPLILTVSILIAIARGDELTCDGDYTQNEKFCYKLMDAIDDIAIADENCKKKGGNLISIHNDKENAFATAFGVDLLIGLHYDSKAKNYSWIDGTPFDMNSWDTGYPMDPDYFGQCVVLQTSGKWINSECGWKFQYVCKKSISSHECPTPPYNQLFNSGEVSSPGYPGNYISGLSCSYVLIVKNNYTVTFEMTNFEVGPGDVIEIFSGLVANKDYRIGMLDDNHNRVMAFTTPEKENKMLVKFTSKSQTGGFWKFKFYVDPSFQCPVQPNNQFSNSGEVFSPGFPENYISGLSCTYVLSVENGYTVTLEMVENRISSTDDTIEIFSGLIADNKSRIGVVNGNGELKTFTTSQKENIMLVKFSSKSFTGGYWKFSFHTSGVCGNDWIDGGDIGFGYCYKVSRGRREFEEAKSDCEQEGAQLISIHNAFQNKFILEKVSKHEWVFLGLSSKGYGPWEWTDGSELSYENWNYGEPRYRDAVMTDNGRWSTVDRNYLEYSVCYKVQAMKLAHLDRHQ